MNSIKNLQTRRFEGTCFFNTKKTYNNIAFNKLYVSISVQHS